MANNYTKWVMTPKFANMMQQATNSGQQIEWVRVDSSDDRHALSELGAFDETTLKTARIRQTAKINSVTLNKGTATLTALFTSTNNKQDYYVRTLFLVAKLGTIEFLAGSSVSTNDSTSFRMPAASNTEITEFTTRPQITVTSTTAISTTVDPIAAATNERVDNVEKSLKHEIDRAVADRKRIWAYLPTFVSLRGAQTLHGIKTFTDTIVGSITGNAGTATKLQTARKINVGGADITGTATAFNGAADVTIPVTLNNVARTDTTSAKSYGDGDAVVVVDSIKTDAKGRITGVNTQSVTLPKNQPDVSGNSGTATQLKTPRKIGGVDFDGTKDIQLPGVDKTGNQNTTGNAATATKLRTPKTINGTAFDGSQNIEVLAANDADILHKSGDETVNGNKNFTGRVTASELRSNNIKGAHRAESLSAKNNVDLYELSTGRYYFTGAFGPALNEPGGVSKYYLLDVLITDAGGNGMMFLVDSYNQAYWNSRVSSKWRGWKGITDTVTTRDIKNETYKRIDALKTSTADLDKRLEAHVASLKTELTAIHASNTRGLAALKDDVKALDAKTEFNRQTNERIEAQAKQTNDRLAATDKRLDDTAKQLTDTDQQLDITNVLLGDVNERLKEANKRLSEADEAIKTEVQGISRGHGQRLSNHDTQIGMLDLQLDAVNGTLGSGNIDTDISGAAVKLKMREAPFTDFNDVAKNMGKYAGCYYSVLTKPIKNAPRYITQTYTIEVMHNPHDNGGKITVNDYRDEWIGWVENGNLTWRRTKQSGIRSTNAVVANMGGTKAYYNRDGNVVTIEFSGSAASAFGHNASYGLGKIPEGFRPKGRPKLVVPNASKANSALEMTFTADKGIEVKAKWSQFDKSNWLIFSHTWITEDD